jgi:CYTH domain-containing protein
VSSRHPGEGRYAHLEREQRWLLKGLPSGVTNERIVVDHYWTGTTLRLRMIQEGDEVVYKLCQKVRVDTRDPELAKITNIYLSEGDFRALSVTSAAILSKSRWTLSANDVAYAIDEFKGRHAGLVLAEVELGEDEPRVRGPECTVADVTNDNEYSGGWLATASPDDLLRVIAR